MSKMSNIDLIIQNIKNWFKDKMTYIIVTFFLIVLGILIYIQGEMETRKIQAKETRINNIETTLQTQMNYIDKLEADVDNLYRVVE